MVKLFSNFDTKAPTKNYAEAVQTYGFDKVIFVRRHKLYLRLYSILPALIWVGFFLLWLIPFLLQTDREEKVIFIILQIVAMVIAFVILFYALGKYLNYTLDYIIITPDYVAEYNQSWLLKRKTITIEISKIKTINFSSWWLLRSLFNFWRVDILLEWDEWGRWDLTIEYVYNPEDLKWKILEMMDLRDDIQEKQQREEEKKHL